MEPWVVMYSEPLFWAFPVGAALVSVGAFVLFAVPLTLFAWLDPSWARRWRIQPVRTSRRKVVGPAITHFLVNNAVQFALILLLWPLLRKTGVHLGPLPAWWVVALQVGFFVYLDDFLYYWMHRAMHRRWLFKHIHGVHHRVRAPVAAVGHSMHVVEYLLTTAVMLVGPLVLGVHVLTLYVWVVIRQWEAAEGHCGYDFPLSPSRLVPGSHAAGHHDFHHAKVNGNYAGYLPIWDRVFGTFVDGYETYVSGG